ncbi:MAG TPA: hypothetical protein PLU71_05205 [Candidatus Dependentiae bacterium]|nr:hypothetical protein [Candidatus Dependentiae bacterium]HRQ63230.1 hypothetical protein [Candidatus Dependentiae bacterium]
MFSLYRTYFARIILVGLCVPFVASAINYQPADLQNNAMAQQANELIKKIEKRHKKLTKRAEQSREVLNSKDYAFSHITPIISQFEAQELQLGNLIKSLGEPVTMFGHTGLEWLSIPVTDKQEIQRRQMVIRALVQNSSAFDKLQNTLKDIKKGELALLRYWDEESKFNKYIADNFCYKKSVSISKKMPKIPVIGANLCNNSSVALEGSAAIRLLNVVVSFSLYTYAMHCLGEMFWRPYSQWNLATLAKVSIPTKENFVRTVKNIAYSTIEDLVYPFDWHHKLREQNSPTYRVYDLDETTGELVTDASGTPIRVPKNIDQMGVNHFAQAWIDGSAMDRFRLGCDMTNTYTNNPYHGYALGAALLAGYAGTYYKFGWGWFRIIRLMKDGNQVLAKMQKLHRSMSEIAHLMRSLDQLEQIVSAIPALQNSAAQQNLHKLLDKTSWSVDLQELMDVLATGTFDNPDSWMYSRGRTLKAHNLLLKVKDELVPALQAIAEFDAYFTVAQLYKSHQGKKNSFAFVEFVENNTPQISINGCWTPLVAADQAVANNVRLGVGNQPLRMMITGPNGGGKSTFLKSLGHAVMMAQSWGIVPAQEAKLTIFSGLRTSLDPREDLSRGISTFMAQKERIGLLKEYVRQSNAQKKMLVMLDEPFRGTTDAQTEERICDFGNHVARLPHTVVCIATHVKKPVELAQDKSFANYHVEIQDLGNGKFKRLFTIKPGIATQWLNNQKWASRFVDWLDNEIREKASKQQIAAS